MAADGRRPPDCRVARLKALRLRSARCPASAQIAIGPMVSDDAQKLELVLDLNTGQRTYTNHWSFWVFPRNQLLSRASTRVVSNVRWAGLRRLYPFIEESPTELTPGSLLITSTLDHRAIAHLSSGGRVWLLGSREQFERSGDGTFFPESGGALGSLLQDHALWSGFPHDGLFDLQFYNLMEGAWSLSLDKWPKEIVPIAGSIRTTSSFLSKKKSLSKVGYIVEAKAGRGSLLITTLAIREHLDEAYPEAVFLFDRVLRYASGPDFRPTVEADTEAIEKLGR